MWVLLTALSCSSHINVSKIGSTKLKINKGDVLHVEIPAQFNAYIIFSSQFTKSGRIDVDGKSYLVGEKVKISALEINGRVADITFLDSSEMKIIIWIIPSNICTKPSVYASGKRFDLSLKRIPNEGTSCLFLGLDFSATIFQQKVTGGSGYAYIDINQVKECANTTCVDIATVPYFIAINGTNVKYIQRTEAISSDEYFNYLSFDYFYQVELNGIAKPNSSILPNINGLLSFSIDDQKESSLAIPLIIGSLVIILITLISLWGIDKYHRNVIKWYNDKNNTLEEI